MLSIGYAEVGRGEAKYDELERRLAAGPSITVPTITLEGDANGATRPEPASYAGKFTGPYAHRLIKGLATTCRRRRRRPS